MRQRQSAWTSIVLFALVALSLFLTYRILSSPSKPLGSEGLARPTSPSESQSVVSTKGVEDVFVPHQLVLHMQSDIFLSQDPAVVSKVDTLLGEWQMNDVAFQETYSTEAYQQLVTRTGKVEVIFPSPMPLELISRYFVSLPEELFNDTIDRILISANREESVYLVDDRSKRVYTATWPDRSLEPISKLYAENPGKFIDTDIFTFQGNVINYLPTEEFQRERLVYLVERQSNSFFINQLFEDTTELKDNSDDLITSYSDNISELRIHKQTGLLYYYRNNLDTTPIAVYLQIRNSFHEMKFWDNWTNETIFSGYNAQNGEIRYRRYVNGLPIFGSPDMGLTRVKMANSGPIEIQFATQIIQTPLEERQEAVTMPGAVDVFNRLLVEGYDTFRIQGMQVGYEWLNSAESERIVELNPKWYIQMNGVWRTLEEWTSAAREDEESGL